MPSLFHVIDENSLKNNPNLKFDPQNASAHLNESHPTFAQLKDGLKPEQIELLESVTQVDGFNVDGSDDGDEKLELIDPETGELVDIADGQYTLDELGFIDPTHLKTLVMEAFYSLKLEHANSLINQRYDELHGKHINLAKAGYVGKMEANNVNMLLGGGLYDNVIMESFTREPTKTNFNVVMEEIDAGKAAMVAGGAVIGAALIYKLIKWFMNTWNKNGTANQSIGDNIKTMTERSARLESAADIIITAQKATQELKTLIANTSNNNIDKNTLNAALTKINKQDPQQDKQFAAELAKLIISSKIQVAMANTYSNLWQAWLTSTPSNNVTVNKAFGVATKAATDAAAAIISLSVSRLEKIRNTPANVTISDSVDTEYAKHVSSIDAWAKMCGFSSGVVMANIQETTNNLANHVLEHVVKPIPIPAGIKITSSNIQIFDVETFGAINEDLTETVGNFAEDLKKTGGTEKKKFMGLGAGTGEIEGGSVDKGGDVQKDTRVREYNKSAEMFRGAMNVMRSLHSVRNSIGRGLKTINDQMAIIDSK